MTSSPGSRFASPGVSFCGMRILSEQTGFLRFVFLSLPLDIPSHLGLIQSHGGGEISGAPDAVSFEVYLAYEFESCAQVPA